MDEKTEFDQEATEPQSAPSPEAGPAEPTQLVESSEQEPAKSREEALAEVRKTLREEEEEKARRKETSFSARLGRFFKKLAGKRSPGPEEEEQKASEAYVDNLGNLPPSVGELVIPEVAVQEPAPDAAAEAEPVLDETSSKWQPEAKKEEPLVRDITTEQDKWRKDLFGAEEEEQPSGPRPSVLAGLRPEEAEPAPDVSDIRQEALEGYTEEPEAQQLEKLSFRQTLRRVWRDMRPVEKRILIGSLIVIAATAVIGFGAMGIQAILPEPPPPTATPSNIPYPVSISLPGGWVFPLNRGSVVDGKWDPARAEWLAGTEVSRWVALPWNVQLEAVIRTLKLDDPITIFMSNNDSLVFKVKSIEQVPVDNIGTLASKQPSLLLVLSKQDADTRWVVSAVP